MASNKKKLEDYYQVPEPTIGVNPQNRPESTPQPKPKPKPEHKPEHKPEPTIGVNPQNKPNYKPENKSESTAQPTTKNYSKPEPTIGVYIPKAEPQSKVPITQTDIDAAKSLVEENKTDAEAYPGILPFANETTHNPMAKDNYGWGYNQNVEYVQGFLHYYFFINPNVNIEVDGYYGNETVAAVTEFQKEQGLPETGVVDYATLEAMYNCQFAAAYEDAYIKQLELQIYDEYFDGEVPTTPSARTVKVPSTAKAFAHPKFEQTSGAPTPEQVQGLFALRALYDKYNLQWYNPSSTDYNATLYYYFKDTINPTKVSYSLDPIKNNLHPDPEDQPTPGTDSEGNNTYGYGALERGYLEDCYNAGIKDASTTKVVSGEKLTPEQKEKLITTLQKKWGIDTLLKEWEDSYKNKQESKAFTELYNTSIYVDASEIKEYVSEIGDYNGTLVVKTEDNKYYVRTDYIPGSNITQGTYIALPSTTYKPTSKVKVVFKPSATADKEAPPEYKRNKAGELVATVIIPNYYTDREKEIITQQIQRSHNYNTFKAHMSQLEQITVWIAQQRANPKYPGSFLSAVLETTTNDTFKTEHSWKGDVVYTDSLHYSILSCFSEEVKTGDKEAYIERMSASGLDYDTIDGMWDTECIAYKNYLGVFEGEAPQSIRANPIAARWHYGFVEGNPLVSLVQGASNTLDILAKPVKIGVGRIVYDSSGKNILNVSDEIMRNSTKLRNTDMLSYDLNKDSYWDGPVNLALEIVLDPINWFSWGAAGLAKSGVKAVGKTALKEAAEQILQEAPEVVMRKLGKEATEDLIVKALKETSADALEEALGQLLKSSDSVTKAAIGDITQNLEKGAYKAAAQQIVANSDELTQKLLKGSLEEILESKQLNNFYTDLVRDMSKASTTSPYKIFGKNKTALDYFKESYQKTLRKYSGNTKVQSFLIKHFGKTAKLSPSAQKIVRYSLELSNKSIIQSHTKHLLDGLTIFARASETVQKVLATTLFSALSQGLIPVTWLAGKGFKAVSRFTHKRAVVNNAIQKLSDISKENKTINIFDITPDVTIKHTTDMAHYSDSLLEGDHLSTDFFLRNVEEAINIDLHKIEDIMRQNYKNPVKCNELLCEYLKITPTKSLKETLLIYRDHLESFLKDPNHIGLSGEALAKSDSFKEYLETIAKGEAPSEDLGSLYARYVTDDGSEQLLKVRLSGEFRRIDGELYYVLADSRQLIHSAELLWSPAENYINAAIKDIDKLLKSTAKRTLQKAYSDAIIALNRVEHISPSSGVQDYGHSLISNVTAFEDIKNAITSLEALLGDQIVLDALPKQDRALLDKLLKSLREVENSLETHMIFQKQLLSAFQKYSVFDIIKIYAKELKLEKQLGAIQRLEKAINSGQTLKEPIEKIQQRYTEYLNKAISKHEEAFTNVLNKNISRVQEFSKNMKNYIKGITEMPYKPVADSFADYHKKAVKHPQMIAAEKMSVNKASETVKEVLENVESLDASTLKREITPENILHPYKRFGKTKYQKNIKFIESFTFANEGLQKIKQDFVDILKRKNFTKTPEAFEEYSNIWHNTCRELSGVGTKIDAKSFEDYTKLLNLLNQYNPDRFIKNTITIRSKGIIRQLKLADVFIASQYFSAPSLQKTLDFILGDEYFSRFLNSLSEDASKNWNTKSSAAFRRTLDTMLTNDEAAVMDKMREMVLTAVALKESSKGYKDALRLLDAMTNNSKLSKETVNALTESLLKFAENSLDSVTFNYPNFLQKVFDNIDAYNTFKYQTDFYTPNSYINDTTVLDNLKKVFGEDALENLTGLQKDMAILESVMDTLLFKEFNDDSRYIIADLETSAVKGSTSGTLYEISYKSRGGDFVTLRRHIPTKFIEDPITGKPIRTAVNSADVPSTAYISKHYSSLSIEEGYQKFYELHSTGDYSSEAELIMAFTDAMIKNVGEQNTKLVFQNSDKFNMQFLHQKCHDLGIDDAFLTSLEKYDIRQMLAAQDGVKLLTPSEKEAIHQLLSEYLESRKTSTTFYNKLIALDKDTFKYATEQFGCSKFFMIPDERFADNLIRMYNQLENVEAEFPAELVTQTRTLLKNSADEIYNTGHNITQMSSVLNKYLFEDTLKTPNSHLYKTLKDNFNKYLDVNRARLEVQFGMSIDQIKRKYGEAINFTKVLTGLENDTATLAFRNVADFKANLALFKKLKEGMNIRIEDMVKLNEYTTWVANNSERLFNIFKTNSPNLIKSIADSRDSIVEAVTRMRDLLSYSDKSNSAIYRFLDPSTLTDKELLAVYTKQLETLRGTLFEIIERPGALIGLTDPNALKIMSKESQDMYIKIFETLEGSYSIHRGIKLKDTPDESIFLSKLLFDKATSNIFEMLEFSQKGYNPIIHLCDMDDWDAVTQKIMNPESTWHKNLEALEKLDETGFFNTQQQVFAESLRSTQKMIRVVEAIFSPTKATKAARKLQDSFVQAQELVYKAMVTHRLQMSADELKRLMVYQAPWFEISKADIATSSETYKAYKAFLARKAELNAAGIVFEESGGRLYVALTDLEDISYSINRETGKLEAYKGGALITEATPTSFSYTEALQLKGKLTIEEIEKALKKRNKKVARETAKELSNLLDSFCDSWNEAEASLRHMSQGASVGSVGDHMTKETMEALYEQLPEVIKTTIPADRIFADLLWSRPRFNFTNLGTSASRRLKNPQSSTSLITSLVRSSEHAVARAPAILQYTNMFFDQALRLNNKLSVFSKVSNEDIYYYFKNNPEFSLAVLTKSKKATLGCKVVPIKASSAADIKLAKELGAVVVPTNALSKAMDSINNNLFSDGFLEYYKRALYIYKVGYLINPGTALRNFEDGILKNAQELGVTDTLCYTAIAFDLVKKYNVATEELIKLGDGKFAKDMLPYYFGNINKEMTLETYQMLHAFFQDPSSSGMTKVWSKYYDALNPQATRTAWEVFSEGISKALNPMAQVERINRLTLFLGLADQGYTNLEIFQTITKAHFDYSTKSTGAQLLEMFVPFYTFTANNLTYWMNYFTEHPSVLRHYFKAYTKMWNMEDIEDSRYNPSLKYQILNGNTKIGKNTVLKTNFSFMSALNLLANPVKTLKGSLFAPWEGAVDLILDSANIKNNELRAFLGMEDVYESSTFRQTINNFVANNDKEGYVNYCKRCGVNPDSISQNWEIEKKNYKWNQAASEDNWYNNPVLKYIPGVNTFATRIAQASKYYAYTDNPIIPLASDVFGIYKSMPEYTFVSREKQIRFWLPNFNNWKRYETKKSTWKDFSTSARTRYYAKKSYAKRSYVKKNYSSLPYFYSRVYTPHKYTITKGLGLNISSNRFTRKYYNKDGTSKMENRKKTYTPKYLRYRIQDWKYYYNH